jgi:hypothetical protein
MDTKADNAWLHKVEDEDWLKTIDHNDWVLEPFIRVGVFRLGKVFPPVAHQRYLTPWKEDFEFDDSYSFDIKGTESFLSTDGDDVIEHVSCRDHCFYHGRDLIGTRLQDVESLLGHKGVLERPELIPDCYSIDALGIDIWVDDDMRVTVVDASMYIDPNEV